MDNKDKVTGPDSYLINIHENYEVEYWANKLGITANTLREAAQKIGTSVADLKAYLNN